MNASISIARSLALAAACSAALSFAAAAEDISQVTRAETPPAMFGSTMTLQSSGTYNGDVTTIQGGLVYGYGTAAFSFQFTNVQNGQSGILYSDAFQLVEGTASAPTAADHWGVAMTGPYTNNKTSTTIQGAPITKMTHALVRMANWNVSTAQVFKVVLANGKAINSIYQDPSGDSSATAVCSALVPLVGTGAPNGAYVGGNLTSMVTYSIPLTSFSCSKGTLTTLKAGVTVVGVELDPTASVTVTSTPKILPSPPPGIYSNAVMNTVGDSEDITLEEVSFY
jgi:hypothetical protein